MANKEDNLLRGNPDTQFKSGRNAVENGRKGGIASGIAKREKKSLRSTIETLLEYRPTEKELEYMRDHGIDVDDDATYRTAVAFAIINKAVKGNTRAFEMLRDTIGEKPTEKVEVTKPTSETVAEMEEFFERKATGNTSDD